MYEIIISETALRQLNKLETNIKKRIISTLRRIRIRPEAYVKKLIGDPGYMLRVGHYRVILDIDKKRLLILVIKVSHRGNIYK